MTTSSFAAPLYNPRFRAFTTAGAPLAGGKLYVYLAGTTTLSNSYPTYADALAGTNANANPVILDANGEASIFLPVLGSGGLYKIKLTDSTDVLQWIADNVNPTVASSSTVTAWTPETNTVAYVSAASFSVATDVSATYNIGRRVRVNNGSGYVYGTITGSSFASVTTVTGKVDSGGSILNTITGVAYGIESYTNPSYLDPRSATQVTKSGDQTGFAAESQVTSWTGPITNAITAEWAGPGLSAWTCIYPGIYLVNAGAEVSDTVASQLVTMGIAKNATNAITATQRTLATGGLHSTLRASALLNLASGDLITMRVVGTVNTTVYAGTATNLSVLRIA